MPTIRGMSSHRKQLLRTGGDALDNRQPVSRRQMAIPRRHRDRLMPRRFLDFLDTRPCHCQPRTKGVSVAVPDVVSDACLFPARMKPRASVETVLGTLTREK